MNLSEFKQSIIEHKFIKQFYILECADNYFLADQYIDTICNKYNLEKVYVSSILEEESALNLVLDQTELLNVLKVDTFKEAAEDYSQFENTIVICKKIDKSINALVQKYVIKIPTLVDWQVKAYIKTLCPELDDLEINWLYDIASDKITKDGIYRLQNELDKLNLFSGNTKKEVLAKMAFDPKTDLYKFDIYALSAACILGDLTAVKQILKYRHAYKLELINFSSLLLSDIKKIILVCHNSGKKAAEIGLTAWQYDRVKTTFCRVPLSRLQELLYKVSQIDLQLKNGLLEFSSNYQIDYLLTQIL